MKTVNTVSSQNALCIEVQARFQGTLRQVLQLSPVRSLFIGDAEGCDLFVAPSELGSEKAPLILVQDGRAYFCFNASMRARSAALASLVATESNGLFMSEIKQKSTFSVSFESGLSFEVKATEKIAAPSKKSKLDAALLGYTGGSVLMNGMIMALIFSISPDAHSLNLTNFQSKNEVLTASVSAPEIKEEQAPVMQKESNGSLTQKKTPAHTGVMTPRTKDGGIGTTTRKDVTSTVFQPEGVQTLAKNVGVLSLLQGGALQGGAVSSALTEGTENFFGDNLGDRPGDDFGNPFGRPDGEGSDQMGNEKLAQLGDPGVKNKQGGVKSGTCFNCEARTASGPDPVTLGTGEIPAGIDKDSIRRVIKRAMPGIKFCYEQGLQQNADLAGKVRIHFVIAANGSVADSRATDGIDPKVDSCVANKIAQLSFPMPPNGNIVEITYPFMFQSSAK